MALSADMLLDRLYLKSQVARWRVGAIIFAVLALLIFVQRMSPHSAIEKEYVARITISGIITDDQKLYNLFDDVAKNDKVKAVVVWLDTPGGSAVGGEETYLHLRQLAAKKPVVAVMRSVAASAGYMASLGADYVFAREGTITGSIGVIIETAEVTELADKLGIKPIIIKSAPLKGSPSPLEKSTPEGEKALHDVINDFYNRFVDMVAERRGIPRDKVVVLADGRVYSGKAALDRKLIDAMGGEEDAMKWLVDNKHIRKDLEIKDVKIEEDDGFFDHVSSSFAGKFFQKSSLTLDGMAAVWHPQLY